MVFELRIRFKGDEGDEMPVVDLMTEFAAAIERRANVKLLPMELHILDKHPCIGEGRLRASRD